MKNNYIKKILLLIIFLLIIIFINILLLINTRNKSINYTEPSNKNGIDKSNINTLDEEIIIPNNSYLFFGKYVMGEVSAKEIYGTIYKFANNIIPEYYIRLKDSSNEEIKHFYITNKEKINNYIIINNEEEFLKFIEEVKLLHLKNQNEISNTNNSDELILESLEFIEEGMNFSNTTTYSQFSIKYKNCEQLILNVKVFKKLQSSNRNILFYYEK